MRYTFTQVCKGIILVESETQYDICSMFLRPQEFYESPYENIRGKYFSLEEYMDTYANDKGTFSYYTDWCGFNIPSDSLKMFVKMFAYSLSRKESFLLASLCTLISFQEDFYIIGVCKEKSNKETLDHEMAHAFWYFDKKGYRNKLASLNKKIPTYLVENAFNCLQSAGYDTNMLEDEYYAYLTTSSRKQILQIFGWGAKTKIPKAIREFFKKYKSTYK